MRSPLLISIVLALTVTVAACGSGEPASSSKPKQTVTIEMTDNAYSQDIVQVQAGKPVELTFKNEGKVDHEAIVGDKAMQAQHEEDMQAKSDDMGGMSGMDHGGSMDSDAITVKPGETGTLTYTFKASDDGIIIGCHEPGHYDSGMKMAVSVQA